MKFKFIKSNCKDAPIYGGQTASTGDHVDFDGHFAEKAKNNPDFELATIKTKKVAKNGNSSRNKK